VIRSLLHRRRSRVSLFGASVVAALLGGAACLPSFSSVTTSTGTPTVPSHDSSAVRIGKAVRGDLSGTLMFTAEVAAKGSVAMVPRVTARLDKIAVAMGARVHAGDTLAELDRSDLEQDVQQAQAAQASAEAKVAQLKAGAKPEAQNAAQASLNAAQARLTALQAAPGDAASADALAKRVADARAKLDDLSAATPPDPQVVARANAAVATARAKLSQITSDPTRSKDQNAVDAARKEQQQADDAAATAARPTPPNAAAVEAARRELNDAEAAQSARRPGPTAADLDQARGLVALAEAELKLVSAPASDEEVRAAQAAADHAAALTELARSRLNSATITAPINGVVTDVTAQPGATVGPTAAILTLIPPELRTTVQVDETQAAQLQAGQPAQLSIETLPQDSFQGVVKGVAPILDPRTRTVAVEIEVPDPRGKLRPGMFSQVQVQTGARHDALLVPKDAVLRVAALATAPAQSIVWVVADNRVRRQKVAVGASDAQNVEIVQGVNEGADVVLNPSPDLIDGQLIIAG